MPPTDADALRDRGNAFYLQGRFADAATCYEAALRLRPDDGDARNNLGAALADLGRLPEAVACYQAVLTHWPGHADAQYNLGNALRLLGRHEEAVASYARALRLRPGSAEAYNNLGIALRILGRLAEAEAALREAVRLRPDYALALNNLGLALADSGRLAEALASYDSALALEPAHADAHRNRSLAWLLAGDYGRGFPEYAWRWRCADFPPVAFDRPAWDGSPLDGRTILLYTEQGLGDTLQFVRFARSLHERGGRVYLAAQDALLPLLDGVAGIDRLIPRGETPAEYDVHSPLLSVPGLLGTTEATLPADVPYLRADPARIERWRRELEAIAGFRVGITWQGNTRILYDRHRSFPLTLFEPLARIEGVRLISLQRGPGVEQIGQVPFDIVDLGPRLDADEDGGGAFLDTAAMMAGLDLVITCDTAIAHLAGALGVRTWVVLPAVPDWRWGLDRADSPWYPTVRLFRQHFAGVWDEPFARMAAELRWAASAMGTRSIPIGISPGELIDRITILKIKAGRIDDPARRANVAAELAELTAAREASIPPAGWLDELADRLEAVNLAIWETEDAVRAFERNGDFGPAFVERARSVYYNNDERARLKRQINDRLGWGRQEEKSYAPYARGEEPRP